MIFVVSGEGPSDIGKRDAKGNFVAGPMARLIDGLVEQITANAPLDYDGMEFVSESELARVEVPRASLITLGRKSTRGTASHTRFAQQLALQARELGRDGGPVAAILFRDADGTRSTERGLYEAKCEAIERGFKNAQFDHGVAMVPKPKSEAWLICALKHEPYQNCSILEEVLSGNDNSPEPAKTQLADCLNVLEKTVGDLADLVADRTISPFRIDMPSFNRFRARLEDVTRRMAGLPQPPQN